MRQRRKSVILGPIKWIVLLGAVGTVTVTGLSAAGMIEWKADANLDRLMFWKSASPNQAAAPAGTSTKPAATASIAPTATPMPQTAAVTPAETPKASPTPVQSVAPTPTPVKPVTSATVQVVSQAASLLPVNANEKGWLELVGQVKLDPGKLYSFNAWLAEASKGKTLEKKADELSHVASLLYEAAVRAGMKVGERNPHQDLPAYAAAGFDVEIVPDKKDLTLYNALEFPVTVGVMYNGESPILTMNGAPTGNWKAPKITVSTEAFAPERVILTDFTLIGRGEVRRSEGSLGTLAKVYADWKNDGKTEQLSKDFYAPRPVVVARGPSADELK